MTNHDAESQPLLSSNTQVTPLPKAQLAAILSLRLADSISYGQIFPYINAMVEELGIAEPKRVGLYYGMIDGMFALAQFCTVVYWGRLSDRIGRKPAIIIGLSGVSVATFAFGLSTTLWQLLLFRALIGAFCGNIAVIHSAMSDITDKTNQSKAFPLVSASYYIGGFIGPFLGGMLSHPAERYPSFFGSVSLLRKRPFFLPCLASALIIVATIFVGIFFMKETLPGLGETRRQKHPDDRPSRTEGATEPPSSVQTTTLGLFADRRIRPVVLVGFWMSFASSAIFSGLVLWSYTPLAFGGIQQEPAKIGVILSTTGTLGVAGTLIVFPYLHERFKTTPLLTATLAMCGVVYVLIPSVGFIIRKALPPVVQQGPAPPLGKLWAFVLCILLVHRVAAMSYPAYMLVVKESIQDPRSVGAVFGLIMAATCLGESTAPPFVSSLFVLSVDKQILGGNLVWLIMFGISALGASFSHFGLRRPVS